MLIASLMGGVAYRDLCTEKELGIAGATENSAWKLLETLLRRYANGRIPQLQERGGRKERAGRVD